MNIREAIEAAKVVAPFADEIIKASESGGLDAAMALLTGLHDTSPTDSIRLLSLLHHVEPGIVLDELTAPGAGRMLYFEALTIGLSKNSLMDIVAFSKMLGMGRNNG